MTTVAAQPRTDVAFDEAIRTALESRKGGWIERRRSHLTGMVEVFEVEDPSNSSDTIRVRLQATGAVITSEPQGLQIAISASTPPATAIAVLEAALSASLSHTPNQQ
jgi:hypothetical protein